MHAPQPKSVWRTASLLLCLPLVAATSAGARTASLTSTGTPSSTGMTIAVSNCNDSGAGSLRHAVAIALSGDTVDLRRLTCGNIVLTSGKIIVSQTNLTLVGPGYARLGISGNDSTPVFSHEQPSTDEIPRIDGALRIEALSIMHGRIAGENVLGGCIYSQGDVVLESAQLHDCVAKGTDPYGASSVGGGIFAWGDVTVLDSKVCANRAGGGGGIYASGRMRVVHSRICTNLAVAGDGGGLSAIQGLTVLSSTIDRNRAPAGAGGGFAMAGAAVIDKSTIAYNRAETRAAGYFDNTNSTRISDSTISGNVGGRGEAGIQLDGQYEPTAVLNSTIAFNVATFGRCPGAGVALIGPVRFESTIVYGNTCQGKPSDVGPESSVEAQVVGSNNLIGASKVTVPADTITADPQLLSLAHNGGPTLTHALGASSPAIDRGNNKAGFSYDQRGPGFPRVKGLGPDIGAYER
jgi:hypothetical protein